MDDVRGDVLRPPHGTTPAAVKSNIKSEMRYFKSNENIHKKEGGSYYMILTPYDIKYTCVCVCVCVCVCEIQTQYIQYF